VRCLSPRLHPSAWPCRATAERPRLCATHLTAARTSAGYSVMRCSSPASLSPTLCSIPAALTTRRSRCASTSGQSDYGSPFAIQAVQGATPRYVPTSLSEAGDCGSWSSSPSDGGRSEPRAIRYGRKLGSFLAERRPWALVHLSGQPLLNALRPTRSSGAGFRGTRAVRTAARRTIPIIASTNGAIKNGLFESGTRCP
jgi:hypothetical protein